MKRLTLMHFSIVAAAVPMLAFAQVQPVPPLQPVQPTRPAAPIAPRAPRFFEDLEHSLIMPKLELEHSMELMNFKNEMQLEAQEMRMLSQELAQLDVERLKLDAEELKQSVLLNVPNMERMKMAAEDMRHSAVMNLRGLEGLGFGPGEKPLNGRPKAPWASEDPADSLYRVAREALNRGEYRRAAQIFNEVTKKYPRSQYAVDCAYWEAFARYRAGGSDDLREALRILNEGRVQFAQLRNDNVDVQALRARVQGALAARGDTKAAEALKLEASQSRGCDREEISVRAEALSALGQMDPAAAKPAIRKVLARRDECTVELRRRALYLVGRQADGDAASTILDVAKNDPDAGIRSEAMRWLPRVAGDNAVPQLEELLRTSTDEQTQRSVIHALASIDSERARRAIRTIIERNDAGERVRYDAILSISKEKDGRAASAEDMAYVRSLYAKLEPPRLKEAVLTAVSRSATPADEQFLLAVARNGNETPSLRAAALQRLGRMSTVGVGDIARLYDGADARSLREQILSALSQRKEPEAIDKIMEIARKDTDPQIRRYAINVLMRSNNERAKQLLKEMIEQ
jgi:TolA-binding protein/HEAT repeat protein